MPGAAAYLAGSVVFLIVGYQRLYPLFLSKVSERNALGMAGLTIIALIVLFTIMYPIADARPGGGSDADDALGPGVGASR